MRQESKINDWGDPNELARHYVFDSNSVSISLLNTSFLTSISHKDDTMWLWVGLIYIELNQNSWYLTFDDEPYLCPLGSRFRFSTIVLPS